MAWFTRFDRFGGTHLCFSQEQATTCTLASVKMVVFKINKLRPGYAPIISEARVEQIFQKYDEDHVSVVQGGGHLCIMANVLNELNLGTWEMYRATFKGIYTDANGKKWAVEPDIPGGIIDTWRSTRGYPMILDIGWNGGGTHAVVLDTVRRRGSSGSDNICGETWRSTSDDCWGTICDPADGDVHVINLVRGQKPIYKGKRNKWSFNAWGKAAHNYPKGASGDGVVYDFLFCTKKR
jgi:hypothetical protein